MLFRYANQNYINIYTYNNKIIINIIQHKHASVYMYGNYY